MASLFQVFQLKTQVLFPLIVLNLPYDGSLVTTSEDFIDPSSEVIKAHWTLQLLDDLAEEMQLDAKFVAAYVPLIPSPGRTVTNPDELKEAFVNKIELSPVDLVAFLCHLITFLMIGKFYDSRGRILSANMARTIGIDTKDFLFIERKLYQYFLTHVEEIKLLAETVEEKVKKRRAKYFRYAKIGVVTLGAGAVVAVTGGLAAPAIAAALVVMGTTSAAAAAATATAVACIFGGTAAGLSGYKMMKRTRGITEFEFEHHFEETMPSIMIVISGWQKRPEDYKRAVGVVPSQMEAKERLTRFYSCHCPDRLLKLNADLESFENDIDILYNELLEMYGVDPRNDAALVPAKKSLQPLPYARRCLEEFLVEFHSQAESIAKKESPIGLNISSPKPVYSDDDADATYVVNGNKRTMLGSWDEDNIAQLMSAAEQHRHHHHHRNVSSTDANAATGISKDASASAKHRSSSFASGSGDSAGQVATERSSDRDEDSDTPCWHWQNLPESQAFSLYLLRWETQLQLELGHSISSMLRSMGASAVQDVLSVTVFTTLAAAAFWPVLLLQLTNIIDNLWTIAVERADQAGKELARALINREHGSRPVTLVGYSLGARVIFSCLRELAHQLNQDVNFYEDDVVNVDAQGSADNGDEKNPDDAQEDMVANSNSDGVVDDMATTLPGATPTAESSSTTPKSSYSSSISHAGSSIFRMVRNTTSSIAHTTSSVVSSAASTAASAASTAASSVASAASSATSAFSSGSSGDTSFPTPNDGKDADQKKPASRWHDSKKGGVSPEILRGLIEHVVLLGAPVSRKSRVWGAARDLIGGRIINGYSSKDMVLGVVYRYQRFQMSVSGVCPVEIDGPNAIENIDLTDIVEKHTDYGRKLPQILKHIDLLRLRTNADLRVLSTMSTSEAAEIQGTIEL
jgi:hypothetical protein